MTLLSEFTRVNHAHPCPVCGRTRFCLAERGNPADPARVLCTKVESPSQWKEAGWLHVLRDEEWRRPPGPRVRQIAMVSNATAHDFGTISSHFRSAVDPIALREFAARVELSTDSLEQLGTGWADRRELQKLRTACLATGCWSFPMVDGAGRVVGIRLRTDDGFKFAVTGGKQGLFVPAELRADAALLVAEGPTDTAALLDLGFAAVGRPSCTGGVALLIELLRTMRTMRAVVVADNDGPGRCGATACAAALAAYVPDVRVIGPPEGVKDARAWKQTGGATQIADQITDAIEAAEPARLAITSTRRGR